MVNKLDILDWEHKNSANKLDHTDCILDYYSNKPVPSLKAPQTHYQVLKRFGYTQDLNLSNYSNIEICFQAEKVSGCKTSIALVIFLTRQKLACLNG